MSVYIKFYNVADSTNSVELGPFASIVCDGIEVTAVFDNEEEQDIANYDEGAEMWHVFECSGCPLFYQYFEVYRK